MAAAGGGDDGGDGEGIQACITRELVAKPGEPYLFAD